MCAYPLGFEQVLQHIFLKYSLSQKRNLITNGQYDILFTSLQSEIKLMRQI